jgi:hypothetical protein
VTYRRYSGICFEPSVGYTVAEIQTKDGDRYSSPVALPYRYESFARHWFYQQFEISKFWVHSLVPRLCTTDSLGRKWSTALFNTDPSKVANFDIDPDQDDADPSEDIWNGVWDEHDKLYQPYCFSKYMEEDVGDVFFVLKPAIGFHSVIEFHSPAMPSSVKKENEVSEEYDGIGIHKWKTMSETRICDTGKEVYRQSVTRCTDYS